MPKLLLKKNNEAGISREIGQTEAIELMNRISERLNVDISEMARKIALKYADGFSVSKNRPYMHFHIGNGYNDITIDMTTSENKTTLKVPKSSFLASSR